MGLQALREGAGSGILKYFLMSLLLLAVGGLAFTDVGGFFSDGVATNDVAVVGDESISSITFDQNVRRRLSGSQITPQMAYQIGYIDQILNTEIQTHLIKQAAEEAGIKIGQKDMAKMIGELLPSVSQPGETPSVALQRLLRNSGLSEQRFLNIMERDQTAAYMNALISTGFSNTSENLAKDIYTYNNEQRSIELVLFKDDQFTDFEKPTEERLQNYYSASKQNFLIPETRDIKLIKINTGKIRETIKINEEDIRTTYDEDIEAYTKPETRKIEQAIFQTEEEAQAAYKTVKEGTPFEKATNKDSKAVTSMPEQSFRADEMMSGLGPKTFAHKEKGILPPIKTNLGWYLVQINDITPSQIQPYESVKNEIKNKLIENQLADELSLLADQLDDALATGAQPEEIAQEIDIEITAHTGISPNEYKTLNAYGENAKSIIESAFELFEGESSSVFETKNGDIIAVNLYNITAESYKEFEAVKEEIRKKLHNDSRKAANKSTIRTLATELRAEEKTNLDSFAQSKNKYLQKIKALTRNSEPEKPLRKSAILQIFTANVNDIIVVDVEGGSAIIQITSSTLPDATKAKAEELEKIKTQLVQSTTQEALSLFVNKEREKRGVKINKTRLKTAYSGTDNYQ